uniref:Secreted protein n=1 Tax=Heterorhabditis bacteriophora TaxID=37862 RepID=A0A1I7XND5_HETBA
MLTVILCVLLRLISADYLVKTVTVNSVNYDDFILSSSTSVKQEQTSLSTKEFLTTQGNLARLTNINPCSFSLDNGTTGGVTRQM